MDDTLLTGIVLLLLPLLPLVPLLEVTRETHVGVVGADALFSGIELPSLFFLPLTMSARLEAPSSGSAGGGGAGGGQAWVPSEPGNGGKLFSAKSNFCGVLFWERYITLRSRKEMMEGGTTYTHNQLRRAPTCLPLSSLRCFFNRFGKFLFLSSLSLLP